MKNKYRYLFLISMLLSSCIPFSGPLPGDETPDKSLVQHLQMAGNFTYSVDLGETPQSVYFVFSNTSTIHDAPSRPEVQSAIITIDGKAIPAPQQLFSKQSAGYDVLSRIQEFNRDPYSQIDGQPSKVKDVIPTPPLLDSEGEEGNFYDDGSQLVPAHCRKVITDIDIGGGQTRTLNIWVADDCWDGPDFDPLNKHRVTQNMVDILGEKFLKAGLDNDIYDWVKGIVGAEWGDHSNQYFIPRDDAITIFLYDISDDNSDNGGIVGFFWAKDNFKSEYYSDSNERIMFYIDAIMYATPDGSWDITDYWPEIIVSTLAHEFQHMIHFFQKQVLYDLVSGTEIWINEMCSLVVEDLLADKLDVPGPRGVDGDDETAGLPNNTSGRLPLFNEMNNVSLIDWGASGDLASYSSSYAFGAYITRNFGGAELIRRIVQCSNTNHRAITNAITSITGKTVSFELILQQWAAAVLLSDKTNTADGYRYNSGVFFSSGTSGITYNLGSINMFNYDNDYGEDGPYLFSGSGSQGTYRKPFRTSNIYYEAGQNLTGRHEWSVELPEYITMSAIFKISIMP